MFTGIIQSVGRVLEVRPLGAGRRVRIDLGPLAEGLRVGRSVAVNGLCLTACRVEPPAAEFDVVAESLSRSTLGALREGSRVNLERALPAGGSFDGHFVQGHVDGLAKVSRVSTGQPWIAEFTAEAKLLEGMVPKGSVAIDGVSLTLADVLRDRFRVALIPTTLAETTLADLAVGETVNIEADVLGKYVRRYLQQMLGDKAPEEGLSMETLRRAGFL